MRQLFIKENQQNNHRMTVRDERGQILYLIEGRWGRKDDIITLRTLNGEEHLRAKQSKFSPFPVFEITTQDEKLGIMRKHPGLFGIRDSYFTIYPHKWVITGDFDDLHFTCYYKNDLIMECQKIHKSSGDYFELVVRKDEDVPLCSLITVLLDHYSRKKKDEEQTEITSKGDYDLGFLNNINCSIQYLPKDHQLIKNRE